MNAAELANIRKNYEKGELNLDHASNDPNELFQNWLEQALKAQIPEPTAMTLATVSFDLQPSTRIVLLKDFAPDQLVWYTNYNSKKAQELNANPKAALQFHWVELERVVRIEGLVERIAEAQSDAYFELRPLNSRIGAWASPQSEEIPSRAVLEEAFTKFQTRWPDNPPRPEHWGGQRLLAQRWEFWQGRPSRLHDRVAYEKKASNTWHKTRLAP